MKRNPARMRYKNDKLPAQLCLVSIVFDVIYFVAIYSSSVIVPDLRMGADVILNILFLLIVFWGSEMLKVYDRKWPLILTVVGVIQVVRMLWLPIRYQGLEQLVDMRFTLVSGSLILSAVFLFVAAALSFSNSRLLNKYLNSLKNN